MDAAEVIVSIQIIGIVVAGIVAVMHLMNARNKNHL